jgi:hypothetical protein
VPLPPEFVAPQDGSEKQGCESRAARRWLAAHGPRYAKLDPVYLGDDLYSREPISEDVLAAGGTSSSSASLLPIRPSTNGSWASKPERLATVKRGKLRVMQTYRWMEGVPLRAGDDAITVNWLEIESADAKGNDTCRNSFITDLPGNADTVADLAAAGRARWKIENRTFNVLKTKGYNVEHNCGHGKQEPGGRLGDPRPARRLRTHRGSLAQGTRNGRHARRPLLQDAKMREAAAFLVVASWHNLFEILTFQRSPFPAAFAASMTCVKKEIT